MNAVITDEHVETEREPDSDGWYTTQKIYGKITYHCCGYLESARTYMMEGDGDTCPNCDAPIKFTRKEGKK